MPLPKEFQFSQTSLQDYIDCPRRFELRYVLEQAWPALEAQPVQEHERHLWRGIAFHRMVHQHVIGIPVESLSAGLEDDDLARWWDAYLGARSALGLEEAGASCALAEMALSTCIAGRRLIAKYDLVSVCDGQVTVIDWKTDRRRPTADRLRARMQTFVYPFVIVEAGAPMLGLEVVHPEQVRMVYWFAEHPSQSEIVRYDAAQHDNARVYLTRAIDEILSVRDGEFPLTDDVRRCRYCVYRSLCDRGVSAGQLDDLAEDEEPMPDIDLDLEQIAEISY